MSDPTVRGIVHLIENTKTYGRNDFRKRLVVLEQDSGGRFTNYVPVDFIQESCDSVDELQVGDEVEVTYRLSGRKWQRDEQSEVKFFLNAEASKFSVLKKSSGETSAPPDEGDPFAMVDDSDDEAPF